MYHRVCGLLFLWVLNQHTQGRRPQGPEWGLVRELGRVWKRQGVATVALKQTEATPSPLYTTALPWTHLLWEVSEHCPWRLVSWHLGEGSGLRGGGVSSPGSTPGPAAGSSDFGSLGGPSPASRSPSEQFLSDRTSSQAGTLRCSPISPYPHPLSPSPARFTPVLLP